jgi:hypothetical protein
MPEHGNFLYIVPSILLIGCSTMSTPELFEPGYEYRDSDHEVLAITARNPIDDVIYVYYNREVRSDTENTVLFDSQSDSGSYGMFVTGIGGIGRGEVKRVPVFDGYCKILEDKRIYCLINTTGSPAGIATPSFTDPDSPNYDAQKLAMGLNEPGDVTLLKGRTPLPRQGI